MASDHGVHKHAGDISHYLMDYFNWRRPHQHNDRIPSAEAENRLHYVSDVVDHYSPCTLLSFFKTHEVRAYTILSVNGHEFCGHPDHNPYDLFQQLYGLSIEPPKCADHRATALSSGYIAHYWMNTSVSREERLGMSQWSRCRQNWIAT